MKQRLFYNNRNRIPENLDPELCRVSDRALCSLLGCGGAELSLAWYRCGSPWCVIWAGHMPKKAHFIKKNPQGLCTITVCIIIITVILTTIWGGIPSRPAGPVYRGRTTWFGPRACGNRRRGSDRSRSINVSSACRTLCREITVSCCVRLEKR